VSTVPASNQSTSLNPSATVANNNTFYLAAAGIILVGVIAVFLILNPAVPVAPEKWVAPNIPIDQAIAEGYSVECVTKGNLDGIARNFNLYVECPKFATEMTDTGQIFFLHDGQKDYSYSWYLDDPEWEQSEPYGDETCNEFVDGYSDLDGVSVECKIVQDIQDSKFAAPEDFTVYDDPFSDWQVACERIMSAGSSEYDAYSDVTAHGLGIVQYNGKEMCGLKLTGSWADDCGEMTIYLDGEAYMGMADEVDTIFCETGLGTQSCEQTCLDYAYLF